MAARRGGSGVSRLSTGSERQIRKSRRGPKALFPWPLQPRSDVGLVIEPAAWMAGGAVHSGEKGRRLFGDMTDGFGFGRADGGDQVGGEETP
jgi:hypothetical protein